MCLFSNRHLELKMVVSCICMINVNHSSKGDLNLSLYLITYKPLCVTLASTKFSVVLS